MAWTLCSSYAAIAKAGKNVNSTIASSAAALRRWSEEAEGTINSETYHDWITTPAKANFAGALAGPVSAFIANNLIRYDLTGYLSLARAQAMMNLNDNEYRKAVAFLKKEDNRRKMIK